MTKAIRPEGLHNLVVALVHWGLFEQPGLDISSIDVPVIELPNGTLPTRNEVKKLAKHIRHNIEELKEDLNGEACRVLNADLEKVEKIAPDRLDITLRQFLRKDEPSLSLAGDGYGTHFILIPTAPELNDDIDGGTDRDASPLQKLLLGFSNTMTGQKPIIRTEFRDHNLDEYPEELIGPSNFFLPEEYRKADHRVTGSFNDIGQFSGTVEVYGEPKAFVCNWTEGRGRAIKSGPFHIDFAVLMGLKKESKLSADDHTAPHEKTGSLGRFVYLQGRYTYSAIRRFRS